MKLSDINKLPKSRVRQMSSRMLENAMTKAKHLYYEKGRSPLSDEMYDVLEDELRSRDPKHELLKKVGAKVKGRKKVKLPHPLYSLSKIKPENAKEFAKWIAKYPGPVVASYKEDGSSLMLHYSGGVLKSIWTRGDGTIGQDVSHLAAVLKVPKKINQKGDLYVRAELVMSDAKFEKYAAADFKNPRNLVAGMANRLNSEATLLKHADVLAYEVIAPRTSPSKGFKLLERLGFDTPPWKIVKSPSLSVFANLFQVAKRKSKHAIDGLVIEADVVSKRPAAGTHSPAYAFAFKMQGTDDSAVVKIVSIDWEETKHGKLQPVIKIPPTKLNGVTVTNVTGHNAFFIQNGYRSKEKNKPGMVVKHLGPGAKIRIVRSGDVIPHVIEVIKGAAKPSFPKVPYKWDKTGVAILMEGSSDLVRDKRITSFFSTLEVEGVKLGVVQQLTAAGFDSIIRILRADADDFAEIPGFQRRKAEKLAASIKAKTSTVELHVLMEGSGMFGLGFGSRRFDWIVSAYPNLLTEWAKLTPAQISAKVATVRGFDKTAPLFGKSFHKFLRWLKKSRIKPVLPKKVKVTGSTLKGQAVCFTGFRDKALEALIVKNGGTIVSGVSKNTTILLHAAGKTSSKFAKAEALGVKLFTPDSFRKKFKL